MLTNEGPDPETAALRRQHQDVTTRILAAMSRRDREALMRYYLDGQAEEQIEAALGLTEAEFRLIKSRARDQFHNVWLQRIAADKPAVEAGSRTSASYQPHRPSLGSRSHYGEGLS
jgi:DNA-directed RNA polymerase specialized sigma24 family protein